MVTTDSIIWTNIQFANVTGFDEEAAKKFGLPIVSAVLKTVNTEGKEIMIRANHLIFNATSPHTLLSTYQMRELGVIVDDVSKRHLKDKDTNGTHSISFPSQGHSINLTTRGALSTFHVTKPTLSEYLNTPGSDIVDISIEHWSPQDHHEELLRNTPGVTIQTHICQATTLEGSNIGPEETLNLISQFDNNNGSNSPSLFDRDEKEFFDTRRKNRQENQQGNRQENQQQKQQHLPISNTAPFPNMVSKAGSKIAATKVRNTGSKIAATKVRNAGSKIAATKVTSRIQNCSYHGKNSRIPNC